MRALLASLALLVATSVAAQTTPYMHLVLNGQTSSGTSTYDQGWIRFLPDAEIGWDRHDGSKYMPPITTYGIFAFMGERAGNPHRLAVSSLPDGSAQPLPRSVNVRVDLAATEAGTFTFSWEDAYLPGGWKAFLVDRQTGAKIKMWRRSSYTFTTAATDWDNRFILRVRPPRSAQATPETTEPQTSAFVTAATLDVAAPAPNPTTGTSRVRLTLPEETEVAVVVYDALGRQAAALDARAYPAGQHEVALPTIGLSPGTYLVRVATSGEARTHRISVVR